MSFSVRGYEAIYVKLPRRLWYALSPSSPSRLIFLFAMTCYSFTATAVIQRMIRLVGVWPTSIDPIQHVVRRVRLGVDQSTTLGALVLAPITESLFVIGIIEILRWLRFSKAVQVAIPALLMCGFHSAVYTVWGLVVAPLFFIAAATYVHWRNASVWIGAQMIVALHFLYNGLGFLSVLGERLQR
jgi:hypothetical protein